MSRPLGSIFAEIAALLGLAAAIGLLGHLLRQPLVVGFILVGIPAGPTGIALVRTADEVELLAELGIALLLFLVGLKLDLGLVRSLGAVALTTGLGRLGAALAARLAARGSSVLAVDFDPTQVRFGLQRGFVVVYGDASDPERLAQLPLSTARWVIVTVPGFARGLTHEDPRKAVLQALRTAGFGGRIAVAARSREEETELARLGVDLVLAPFEDAADRAVELILGEGDRSSGQPDPIRSVSSSGARKEDGKEPGS